jgi:hypothetical protein
VKLPQHATAVQVDEEPGARRMPEGDVDDVRCGRFGDPLQGERCVSEREAGGGDRGSRRRDRRAVRVQRVQARRAAGARTAAGER